MRRAEFLDGYIQKHGRTIGPLHGLPVTVKVSESRSPKSTCSANLSHVPFRQDQFNIQGQVTSLAYISRANDVAQTTSPIVTIFERAGAIIIAKTTLPMAIMYSETISNLFGHTKNPYDRSLTAGEYRSPGLWEGNARIQADSTRQAAPREVKRLW